MTSLYTVHDLADVESENVGLNTIIWRWTHIMRGAKIGSNCIIGQSVFVDKNVIIGDGVKIQNNVSIYDGVIIEDNVFIGPSAVFTNDKSPRANGDWKQKQTIIKKGASIGANSTLVCGIEIGEYSMVGAGAVVIKNVDRHTCVVGVPAKFSGYVCVCGEKLKHYDIKTGVYKCGACGCGSA